MHAYHDGLKAHKSACVLDVEWHALGTEGKRLLYQSDHELVPQMNDCTKMPPRDNRSQVAVSYALRKVRDD